MPETYTLLKTFEYCVLFPPRRFSHEIDGCGPDCVDCADELYNRRNLAVWVSSSYEAVRKALRAYGVTADLPIVRVIAWKREMEPSMGDLQRIADG